MPNVETLLRDHVTLNVDCIDRLYLNGYVARFQRPQNLWYFLHIHRGNPVISPTLTKRMTDAFVEAIRAFAQHHKIPVLHFTPQQRKEDVAREQLKRFPHREGVVLIGVAQEKVSAFRWFNKGPRKRPGRRREGAPCFSAYRGSVMVNQYYFYLLDPDFGLCFIKFSSFPPFNVRVWLNGHEWTKRQLDRRRIKYEELDNGFLSCANHETLQATCDSLAPRHIEAFFRKWLRRLPHPFTPEDRRAGFLYDLSILQMEVSLTQVFDRPIHGREFFEQVIRDNLDVGRPDRVQLLFQRRVNRRTPGTFRTRVITDGVQPSLRFDYKHTGIKQYFKLERALRTETTINDTRDFEVGRSLRNLPHLRSIGRNTNHRLLSLQRAAHHCAVASKAVERVVLPTVDDDGHRAPALRWGDPRSMAVLGALCAFITTPEGFTNRTLRSRVAGLHCTNTADYTTSRMSYDLRRLRLKGIVVRVPHSHRYVLTSFGRRIAFFFTKTYARVLRPVLQRLDPSIPDDVPDPLRRSWHACERALETVVKEAQMAG